MECAKQLFYLQSTDISIDIRLGFNKDALILDGYDIGRTVERLRGESDYEYQLTIGKKGLDKLYQLSGVEPGQKQQLVDVLSRKFNGNQVFSLFRDFLRATGVEFEEFLY